jgi:putative ABC transport system ATP-binding protein
MKTLIEAKGITKDFLQKEEVIHALKETDFKGEEGQFIAIIGPSGSGKSTFLTILGGLQKPTTGEVLLDGKPYSRLDSKKRSQIRFEAMGFILQSSNLIPFLTVKEQLFLYDRIRKQKNSLSRLEELSNRLDVVKLLNKYPDELSGGERQRCAILKALYHDPLVILADEPTAALDGKRTKEVIGLLAAETKREKKLTLMITHDERYLASCDAVYEVVDGVMTRKNLETDKIVA